MKKPPVGFLFDIFRTHPSIKPFNTAVICITYECISVTKLETRIVQIRRFLLDFSMSGKM